MASIQTPPVGTPILTDSGVMSRAWIAWFQSIYVQINNSRAVVELYDTDLNTSVDFTNNIDTSSDIYEIEVSSVLLSSLNSSLLLRASIDGGATYIEVSNGYQWTRQDNATTTTSNNYSSLQLTPANSDNTANYEISGVIRCINLSNDVAYKMIQWSLSYLDSSDTLQLIEGCGLIKTASAVNGLRIIPSAGSITSGTITLYSIN